jgi:hypothetical protein
MWFDPIMEAANDNTHSTFEALGVAAHKVLHRITAGLSCPGDRQAEDYSEFAAKHSLNPLTLLQLKLNSPAHVPRIPVKKPLPHRPPMRQGLVSD